MASGDVISVERSKKGHNKGRGADAVDLIFGAKVPSFSRSPIFSLYLYPTRHLAGRCHVLARCYLHLGAGLSAASDARSRQ